MRARKRQLLHMKMYIKNYEPNPQPIMDVLQEFQIIPGIGKSLSRDLVDLGYRKVNELKGENPETMYQNLMTLRGEHIDRCVLYVFRCAVYYTSNSVHEPESLKWWNWKDGK